MVEEIAYNADGTIFSIEDLTYDGDHKLLLESGRYDNATGGVHQWSREYRYDARGNRTDMFSYQQGVPEAHWIWEYDEQNRLTSSQIVVADPAKDQHVYGLCDDCGLSSGKTVYKYNDERAIIEEQILQPGGKLIRAQTQAYEGTRAYEGNQAGYSYDSHGNWTKAPPAPGRSGPFTYRTITYY